MLWLCYQLLVIHVMHGPIYFMVASLAQSYHDDDVMMGAIASQITSLTIVYSIVYSDADQRKHPRDWPLCGEFTGDRWIPHTNGQLRGKCFHLMPSSWTASMPVKQSWRRGKSNSTNVFTTTLDKREPCACDMEYIVIPNQICQKFMAWLKISREKNVKPYFSLGHRKF